MRSCLSAQNRFLGFKGPRSFKKNFKIGGNVDELKGYRLIPLTPPLFFHFTLPLKPYSQETAQNFEKRVLQKGLRLAFYTYIPVNVNLHHFLKNTIITVP